MGRKPIVDLAEVTSRRDAGDTIFTKGATYEVINDKGYLKLRLSDGTISKTKIKMDDYYKRYRGKKAMQGWEEEYLSSGKWLEFFAQMSVDEYCSKVWTFNKSVTVHPVLDLIINAYKAQEIDVSGIEELQRRIQNKGAYDV